MLIKLTGTIIFLVLFQGLEFAFWNCYYMVLHRPFNLYKRRREVNIMLLDLNIDRLELFIELAHVIQWRLLVLLFHPFFELAAFECCLELIVDDHRRSQEGVLRLIRYGLEALFHALLQQFPYLLLLQLGQAPGFHYLYFQTLILVLKLFIIFHFLFICIRGHLHHVLLASINPLGVLNQFGAFWIILSTHTLLHFLLDHLGATFLHVTHVLVTELIELRVELFLQFV